MKPTEASHIRQQALRLIRERQSLEKKLLQHGRFLRGSILERPAFCGKPGCKCTRGQPHPPALSLERSVKNTTRFIFIRTADRPRARKEALAYKEYRQTQRRWRVLHQELNQVWNQLELTQEESYPFE
jgi:hypothetical protein